MLENNMMTSCKNRKKPRSTIIAVTKKVHSTNDQLNEEDSDDDIWVF